MSQVQSVIFNKGKWNIGAARHWLRTHHYVGLDVDVKPNSLRFRQLPPTTYKKYRTTPLPDGIELVVGY